MSISAEPAHVDSNSSGTMQTVAAVEQSTEPGQAISASVAHKVTPHMSALAVCSCTHCSMPALHVSCKHSVHNMIPYIHTIVADQSCCIAGVLQRAMFDTWLYTPLCCSNHHKACHLGMPTQHFECLCLAETAQQGLLGNEQEHLPLNKTGPIVARCTLTRNYLV